MSNYNYNKKNGFNYASYFYKNIFQNGKKSHVEDDAIEPVGTRTAINRHFSSIVIHI